MLYAGHVSEGYWNMGDEESIHYFCGETSWKSIWQVKIYMTSDN